MNGASLEGIATKALEAVARGEGLSPPALMVVLRIYVRTARPDLYDALSQALAPAVFSDADQASPSPEQLALIAEAAAVSDDDRLRDRAVAVGRSLRAEWRSSKSVGELLGSVDACLGAASVLTDTEGGREMIESAVSELERVVGHAYDPGEGIAHMADQPDGPRGTLDDHVAAASALLTAYGVTQRLPYPMLAEELMQFSRGSWWVERDGVFHDAGSPAADPFMTNCAAVRVLCRLAALHRDDDYRKSAVLAPSGDCAADAGRILAYFEQESCNRGLDAAVYALALDEWLTLP